MSAPASLRRALVAALACGSLGVAVPAAAQGGPPSRAFDRLFSPEPSSEKARLTLQVYQGVDTLTGEPVASSSSVHDGSFTGLNPSAALTAGRGRKHLFVNADSTLRRYAGTGSLALLSLSGSADAVMAGRRSGLRVHQSVSHAPYYDFIDSSRVFISPDAQAEVPTPDRAAYDRGVTIFDTTANAARQLTRRTMVSADYALRYTRLAAPSASDDPILADPFEQQVAGRLSRQLDRHTVLVAGYGFRTMRSVNPAAQTLHAHNIQLGVDRLQQFSIMRRAALQLSGGSSIVRMPDGRRFVLTGNASFRYDVSRTWTAGISAGRNVSYLDALAYPAITEAFTASLGGGIGPRLDLRTSGAYTLGDVGTGTASSSSFHAYAADVRLRLRLTSLLAAYAEWATYQHEFGDAVALPGAFLTHRSHSAVRVGFVISHSVRQPQGGGEQ